VAGLLTATGVQPARYAVCLLQVKGLTGVVRTENSVVTSLIARIFRVVTRSGVVEVWVLDAHARYCRAPRVARPHGGWKSAIR
jgi:hypothetical protein